MKVAFHTLGCKVNQYETELMAESLENKGFEIVNVLNNPDVFILNSCTVTAESDRKTRQLVRKYRKLLPDAIVVLTGCMPQAFPEEAGQLESADIVLGNGTNYLLPDSIDKFYSTHQRQIIIKPHNKENVKSTVSEFHERTKAYLKIEDGCDRFCSYCIIPYARGRVRSKPIEKIKEEVISLVKNGFKEIVLIGINLSAYGKENSLNLADAVEAVNECGVQRIRLGSMEPDQFSDEVIDRLSKISALCPQFHLSLQAGCDNTLKRMNRHYDTAYYKQLIDKLRSKFENSSITTDVMVGFAGETDKDFENSLNFLKEIKFAKAHIFSYSRRKGTVADTFINQISNAEKHRRSSLMIKAADDCHIAFLEEQLQKVFPVLYENRTEDGFYEGYTPNYTLVKTKFTENPSGKIINTKLISIQGEGCIGSIY